MQAIDSSISLANFPPGVVATNVGHFTHARVVVFLGSHPVSREYAADCAYIQKLVREIAIPFRTRILAEDHWKKPKNEIRASHIPDLAKLHYLIDGWDDPEVRKQLEEAEQKWRTLVKTSMPHGDEEKELYLLDCEEKHIRWLDEFTLDTFDTRQESLIYRLFHTLQEVQGRETVILLCGPEHVYSKHPRLQPSCQKLLRVLEQVPFVILSRY